MGIIFELSTNKNNDILKNKYTGQVHLLPAASAIIDQPKNNFIIN